ncbi:MAG: hypothetical protein RDV41_15335, partial [Planctomycetota bacterium]|nr:hypothetical protein [Planctomycetota bacterium]
MSDVFNLLENPSFMKHARTRLRPGKMLPVFIVFLVLSAMAFFGPLVWTQYVVGSNDMAQAGAISVYILWGLQGLALGLIGSSRAATSMGEEKESGMLESMRITPTSGVRRLIGHLFGGPIREYLIVAASVPFALGATLVAKLPIHLVLLAYLIGWVNVVFYHSFGLVAGLTAKNAKTASGTAVAFVIVLNVMLAPLT